MTELTKEPISDKQKSKTDKSSKPPVSAPSTAPPTSKDKKDTPNKSQIQTEPSNKTTALPSARERSQGDDLMYEKINLPTRTKVKKENDSISSIDAGGSQSSVSSDDGRKRNSGDLGKHYPTKIKPNKSKYQSSKTTAIDPNGKGISRGIKEVQEKMVKCEKLLKHKAVQLKIRQAKTIITVICIIICIITLASAATCIVYFKYCGPCKC